MKLAFAIAFLFIGLVHSIRVKREPLRATISTEAFDKKAITTADTVDAVLAVDAVDTLKSSLDTKKDAKREAIDTKKDSLDTIDAKKVSLDTVDVKKDSFDTIDTIDIKKSVKREPLRKSLETIDAKRDSLDTIDIKKSVKREPLRKSLETIDAKKDSLDTIDIKKALDTIDTVPVSDVKKDSKRDAFEPKKNSVETIDAKKVSLDTVDPIKRSFDWPIEIPEGMNSSQCIYKPDELLLSCKGPSATVECSTEWVTGTWKNTDRFHVLGLAPIAGNNSYWLYIRHLNHTTYQNYTVANGTLKLQLWSGEAASDVRGLNVTDFTCWTKIAKVIDDGCKTSRTVSISSNVTNTVEEVGLCGEVLIFDKTIQKRWLYGYGWGLGAGLWGWGGFPYYGYGFGYPYGFGK